LIFLYFFCHKSPPYKFLRKNLIDLKLTSKDSIGTKNHSYQESNGNHPS
jgi:hypothetical protein